AACVRHAEGKPLGLVRSPSPTLKLLFRGWAGGAQHRQPAARRPCPHERKRAVGKDTPKN
ncbi:MAG: hypothetical protein RML94_03750, partial [Bacteroidia bacterium]|nr:hypothetical protein [Bacteroidia bacterium]